MDGRIDELESLIRREKRTLDSLKSELKKHEKELSSNDVSMKTINKALGTCDSIISRLPRVKSEFESASNELKKSVLLDEGSIDLYSLFSARDEDTEKDINAIKNELNDKKSEIDRVIRTTKENIEDCKKKIKRSEKLIDEYETEKRRLRIRMR